MKTLLQESCFDFINDQDKSFILAFTDQVKRLGISFDPKIGSGYCWGRAMIIYRRNKQCIARIYLKDNGILLRLYLNRIDEHRSYLEKAPLMIRSVFTDQDEASCRHCHNEKEGQCRFRKRYTLEGRLIEKCNGITFEFKAPDLKKLPTYLDLIEEFLPLRRRRKQG